MAPKTTVLFGAGASIDAGLPDAYQLTRRVYEQLVEAKSNDAVLYAVVVSKLIARNAKSGRSPFEDINIEEVYDGLKRLLNRDRDLLSEFVSGWDRISTGSASPFDTQGFASDLSSLYNLEYSRRFDGRANLQVDQGRLTKLVSELQRNIGGDFEKYRGASLEPFLATLCGILSVKDSNTAYMETFLNNNIDRFQCLATLNYDKLVEVSLDRLGNKVDNGLSQWNDKRLVKFHGKSPKLIKLHGSIDWFVQNDDEIDFDINGPMLKPRAMIFGGQSEKLVPHGPFLHLRHQFYQFLQASSYLLVVGYSFRDIHLNALIRSWIASRIKGKIIIVDPSKLSGDRHVFRYASGSGQKDGFRQRVEIKEIKKGFAASLDEIDYELRASPNLSSK